MYGLIQIINEDMSDLTCIHNEDKSYLEGMSETS